MTKIDPNVVPPDYVAESNTYIKEKVPDAKKKIEMEIGDIKEPDKFFPQFKTKHWENECNFSVRLHDDNFDDASMSVVDGKVQWQNGDRIARLYEFDDAGLEYGGFEFDVLLNTKPASNVLLFTIKTKGFDFRYQGELTQEEIDFGCTRPENAVGSYAVYHKTKKNNKIGDKEYGTGKVFHIYRPWAEDALGKRVWCDLNIDEENEKLTIHIPQSFLDTAVFPVLVDPTFGYTSVGASSLGIANFFQNNCTTRGVTSTLSEAGTLDSIHAAITGVQSDYSVMIYREDSAGSGSHDLVVLLEQTDLTPAGTSFDTFTGSGQALTADDYVLAALGYGDDPDIATGSASIKYDQLGNTRNFYFETSSGSGAYATRKAEDPWTETATAFNIDLSVYITYSIESNGANDERSAELSGKRGENNNRSAEVHGEATTNSSRAAELHGVFSRGMVIDAELHGSLGSDDSRGAEITGSRQVERISLAELHGQDSVQNSRSAQINGQAINPYCPSDTPYQAKTAVYTAKSNIYTPYPKRECN